jgi:integrase
VARTVRDTNLETRAARLRLEPRGKPYWRVIETGLHVGYRRLRQGGGTWIARRFIGQGRYLEVALGTADDFQEADGGAVLNFRAAQDATRVWWKAERRRALGIEQERKGPYTVADALSDYIKDYQRRGGKDLINVHSIVESHILPVLGSVDTARLTAKRIRDWHYALATAPKLVRTKEGAEQRNTKAHDASDSDAVRRRRSRANRILTVLKAALNHAFSERLIDSDEAWRRVEPFHNVSKPRVRYLSALECKRLFNACEPNFRALVKAAILTGARYGELIRLTGADIDLEAATVHIRDSKSGKPRHVPLTEEASEHFEALVLGRPRIALVFQHANGGAWKKSEQARPLLAACERARITPPITFHGLRDTFASMLAMNGAPMAVIAAALGHADTRITERHYAHLSPNYVAETVRAHFPRLSDMNTPALEQRPVPLKQADKKWLNRN